MTNTSWDLDQILKLSDFEKALTKAHADLKQFSKLFTQLTQERSPAAYQKFINEHEFLVRDLNLLYARAMLWEETSLTNSRAKFLKGKVKNLIVSFENTTRPVWLWLKGKKVNGRPVLNDVSAKKLFRSVPRLEYFANHERTLAKYNLADREEGIVLRKDLTGLESLLELRSQIESGQWYTLVIKGRKRTFKTIAEVNKLFQSPDRKIREKAYTALLSVYQNNISKYQIIYDAVVKDWAYEAKERKYLSAINVRNVENDIPDNIITELLQISKKNTGMFTPFFNWKAKRLGLRKLTRFDLYAPFTDKQEPKVPYNSAKELILKVLENTDQEFHDLAESFFNQKHVDAIPKPGKSSGGFCMTFSTTISPYILLNYLGTKRDIMVMAHELGHGIHGIYAQGQSILTLDAPLVLAETASTFLEMLLFDHLLAKARTAEEKAELLSDKISDIYATIIKQAYLVMFELEAHNKIPEGLQLEDLNKIYLRSLKQQYGKGVSVTDIFKYEWAYIPHIVRSPFYCYAYAFGELLALALYHEYKVQGKPYLDKIKSILKAGGSQNPVKLLKSVGIDINSDTFWQEGFDQIAEWIKELLVLSPTA